MGRSVDVVIVGAGIAGLWTFARLRRAGYDVLLLERDAIGCGQTVAAQGILHSGLKYALAGQVNETARQIMAMPDRWRAALAGAGEVDLTAARLRAGSQLLLMRSGLLGGLKSLVAQRALTGSRDLKRHEWPDALTAGGFDGSVVHMDEPVLDVPSVLRALAEPGRDAVRRIDPAEAGDPAAFLRRHGIEARCLLFTAAGANIGFAAARGERDGVDDQHRPLLQGLLRPAPFPLFAHLVGGAMTDKPLATVTTHETRDGEPVWYIGASVAERPKEADPREVVAAATRAFAEFLPRVDLVGMRWATLPIDRVEGRMRGLRMPDTPTLHRSGTTLYGWPTKLTFAPLLADMVVAEIGRMGIGPSGATGDFSFLPPVGYADTMGPRDMELVDLGDSGLRVSPLGIGTVKFGRNQGVRYPASFEIPDEERLAGLLDLARSLGINLLDTAPAYGDSEERLGRLLRGQRDRWVSKVGEEFADGVSTWRFTPDHFERSLERSLRRLGTDRLDALLIHADATEMSILADDALLRTMHGFKEQGLVGAIGMSTKTAAGGVRTLELMDLAMVTYTPDYTDERPVLDFAAAHGKGVILKKVLSSGHAADVPAALRFAFAHPGTGCAIVGTINPDHLRQLAAGVEAAVRARPAA